MGGGEGCDVDRDGNDLRLGGEGGCNQDFPTPFSFFFFKFCYFLFLGCFLMRALFFFLMGVELSNCLGLMCFFKGI